MSRLLDMINKPNDIKRIDPKHYGRLAKEIRSFLIEHISKTGGHLASNLGVVELTMVLHLLMDLPKDKIVWDVGHQSYVHKILTGRKNGFTNLRQLDGLSGFPKMEESPCDSFDTGHSSTSISAALGLVKARDLKQEDSKVVAVIGDGALTGGMAYEALNNAGRLKTNFIVVLNDNNMSISENVGGMANYLAHLRASSKYTNFKQSMEQALGRIPGGKSMVQQLKRSKDALKYLMLPSMLFEDMGLTYIGPIDGHNIGQLMTAFQTASRLKKGVVVHIITKKGKGYSIAEKYPSRYHGVDPFDVDNGKPHRKDAGTPYTKVFSNALLKEAQKNDKVVAITAAMPNGTGLQEFKLRYPDRFFDVGIAEEHAVTFAAGLAIGGFRPVVAIYSTFLQRSYDQIIHDVCINKLPVIFAIDRAGITGSDGKTHQGIYDISFLSHIPNLLVMAPKNGNELEDMLHYSLSYDGPVAIRYPKGDAYEGFQDVQTPINYGKSELLIEGSEVALIAIGNMVKIAAEVCENLKKQGLNPTLINGRFISPIDESRIESLIKNHKAIITLEENIRSGGYGQKVSDYLCHRGYENIKHLNISIPDGYVEHGTVKELFMRVGLDTATVEAKVLELYKELEL